MSTLRLEIQFGKEHNLKMTDTEIWGVEIGSPSVGLQLDHLFLFLVITN